MAIDENSTRAETAGMLTPAEATAFLNEAFGHWHRSGVTITGCGHRHASLRKEIGAEDLRPGNTVSGPTLFTLADTALYVAVLSSIGLKVLAVTSSLTINFLRKPKGPVILVECKLLKLGKSLAVGEVFLFNEGEEEPVAHATGTYSLP